MHKNNIFTGKKCTYLLIENDDISLQMEINTTGKDGLIMLYIIRHFHLNLMSKLQDIIKKYATCS